MWNNIILIKYFKIIPVFYFTHVTTSETTEIKLFQPLQDSKNYFKIISATMNMLENIRELQEACK